MQQRKLGYTDLYLTTIGFGAWAIGGPWDFGWGPQDDDESIATIQAGLDAGDQLDRHRARLRPGPFGGGRRPGDQGAPRWA